MSRVKEELAPQDYDAGTVQAKTPEPAVSAADLAAALASIDGQIAAAVARGEVEGYLTNYRVGLVEGLRFARAALKGGE